MLFLLFTATNSLFIFLFFPARLQEQAFQAYVDKANGIATMAAYSIGSSLEAKDGNSAEQILSTFRQNPDITFFVVLDDSERVFLSHNKVTADLNNFRELRSPQLSTDGSLYNTTSVVSSRGRHIGRLYVGHSLRALNAGVAWSRTTIGLVSLALFVLGGFIVYGISVMATGSLRHLMETAEKIAKGDLKRRAQVQTKDEVGYVAKAFNQMVDRLESTRREMENLNRSLETRVKERTRELLLEIAERKQAEEKIREQAALLNISQDAIVVRDLEDTVVFWNSGAESLYGWSRDEATGRKLSDMVPSKLHQDEAYEAISIRGEWRGEIRQVTKAGKELSVESRWTVIRDAAGKPKSVLVVNTDITEKKNLERQFLRIQRMESIGTLAGGIAHDLNNVLAPIMISLEVLRHRFTDEGSRSLISSIESSAKRGAEMVKQVLTFARGAEGERVTLQLKHLIKEMQSIARETFPRTIEIVTDVDKELWALSGDATQLHQVLLNLCVNGRDAMPGGGTLTLTVRNSTIDESTASRYEGTKAGPHVVLTVSDTGSGIPPHIIDKIFEPFFTTKDVGVGTGLGLSTALSIVKGHGGFMTVDSTVGKGTEFKVYLPALGTGEMEIRNDSVTTLPTGKGELVMVVDDEAAICQITKTMLETYGYKTVTASDGTEGVAIHSRLQGEIKAILTDMMMPVMSGPEMVRSIRGTDGDVKIIASSGLSSGYAGLDEDAIDAILSKPYTAEKLLTTLRDLLADEPEHVEA